MDLPSYVWERGEGPYERVSVVPTTAVKLRFIKAGERLEGFRCPEPDRGYVWVADARGVAYRLRPGTWESMKKRQRRPRRVRGFERQYSTGLERMQAEKPWPKNNGIPPAYHCVVLLDWPEDRPLGEVFLAECCNPHCDGEITNRYGAPWCQDCMEDIPLQWRAWFWKTQTKKAFDRFVKDVFQ